MQNSGMVCKKHHVLKVDLTEQEKQKVKQEEAQGKMSIKQNSCVILQSHALNLRFDMSVIYKRQANVAGELLRSIKTKEPRQAAWRPSSAARAEGMAETRQRTKAECHGREN